MLIEASNTNERYKFNIHRRLNIIKGNSGMSAFGCHIEEFDVFNYGLDGNKMINVLVGTRFEFLLRYL